MQANRKITVCRIVYEFAPLIGGSITHTIELAKHMAPYCEHQFVIAPEINEDTTKLDASFPFEVFRVKYCEFKGLQNVKSRFLKWLPVAPLINFSFGFAAMRKCLWLNKKCGIDIIHAHGIGVGPLATIAGKIIRKPTVWVIDGTQEVYSKIAGLYESFIVQIFRPDHVLVGDDHTGPNKFKRLLPHNKMTVVVQGIDTQFFSPKIRNKELAKENGVQKSNLSLWLFRILIR